MATTDSSARPPGMTSPGAADWDPALYSRFEAERTRPARELLAAVPLASAAQVYDLGCGPGNSTELLCQRFPEAAVAGMDSSAAMIEDARRRLPACAFERADIADWSPARAPQLVYANASLQWLGDHERLIPRLFATLADGGALAFQVPDNLDEPSHRLMREVAADPRWAALIGDASQLRTRPLPAEAYYDLLAPHAAAVDVWRTVYHHPMPGADAIVQWLRSTGLRPFLAPLPPELQAQFLAEYERRIAAHYAPRADGLRLLAFPRLFVVARRRGTPATSEE